MISWREKETFEYPTHCRSTWAWADDRAKSRLRKAVDTGRTREMVSLHRRTIMMCGRGYPRAVVTRTRTASRADLGGRWCSGRPPHQAILPTLLPVSSPPIWPPVIAQY